MARMITCAYCGREREAKYMIRSAIRMGFLKNAWVCKQDTTTCLKIRAGSVKPGSS